MDSSSIEAGSGLIAMFLAVFGTVGGVLRNTRKNQEKVADDLKSMYAEGVKEGERRMQPKVDLLMSERDQARSDLANARNDHSPRRGRD